MGNNAGLPINSLYHWEQCRDPNKQLVSLGTVQGSQQTVCIMKNNIGFPTNSLHHVVYNAVLPTNSLHHGVYNAGLPTNSLYHGVYNA